METTPNRIKLPSKTKPILVVTNGGTPILSDNPPSYLCFHPPSGRYYIHPFTPRLYLGKIMSEAIYHFRIHVDKLRGAEPQVKYQRPYPAGASEFLVRNFPELEAPKDAPHSFPEEEAYRFVREAILSDPRAASQRLNIPEIARLQALPEPEPSLSLKDVLDIYTQRRKPLTNEEQKKTRLAWKLFTQKVKAKTLETLSEAYFENYANHVDEKITDNEWGARYARNSVNKLYTVINYAVSRGRERAAIGKASTTRASGPRARPEPASTRRAAGGYDSADASKFDTLAQGLQRNPGKLSTAVSQPFAHQGLFFEPEIGSYQNRARQYDPGNRRFMQRDSIWRQGLLSIPSQFTDGPNIYLYAGAAPETSVDPEGMDRWIEGVPHQSITAGNPASDCVKVEFGCNWSGTPINWLACAIIGGGRVTVTPTVCPPTPPTFTSDPGSDQCFAGHFYDGQQIPYSFFLFNCYTFVALYQFYGMNGECG